MRYRKRGGAVRKLVLVSVLWRRQKALPAARPRDPLEFVPFHARTVAESSLLALTLLDSVALLVTCALVPVGRRHSA